MRMPSVKGIGVMVAVVVVACFAMYFWLYSDRPDKKEPEMTEGAWVYDPSDLTATKEDYEKVAQEVCEERGVNWAAIMLALKEVDSLREEMALLKKEAEPSQTFAKAFEAVKLVPDDFSTGPVVLSAADKKQLSDKAAREKEDAIAFQEKLALGEARSRAMQESVRALETTIEEQALAQDKLISELKSIGPAMPDIGLDRPRESAVEKAVRVKEIPAAFLKKAKEYGFTEEEVRR